MYIQGVGWEGLEVQSNYQEPWGKSFNTCAGICPSRSINSLRNRWPFSSRIRTDTTRIVSRFCHVRIRPRVRQEARCKINEEVQRRKRDEGFQHPRLHVQNVLKLKQLQCLLCATFDALLTGNFYVEIFSVLVVTLRKKCQSFYLV